ncbi:MAG: sodium-dependent transporter [Tissierellaceae bacterium]|nr:sodium-dependent transporter [Tissierellaceae bacterium]
MSDKIQDTNSLEGLENREQFKSRLGFVLASVGGALGLGNVWKFPYMVGKYGGAAFIVVYLIALLSIGLPVLMTEFALGRNTKLSYTGSLKKLLPHKKWYIAGIVGVITLIITLAFYSGIAGWTIAYFFKSVAGAFNGMDADAIGGQFGQFISSPFQTVFFLGLMLILTAGIVLKGVSGGIEKVCNLLLPLLFAMIIFLGVRVLMLPGAGEGVKFYLKPDLSQLNGDTIIAAIGQAFFTLGVGAGNLVVYGSYLDRKETITSSTLMVGIGDTVAAILFGFIIFPAVFAYGIEPTMGPPLVFITLPVVFAQMKFGMFFASTFFLLLFFACLTSTICIMEAIVGFGVDELKISRNKSTIITTIIVFILGSLLILSFGVLSDVLIMGQTLFDFANETLVSTILLPGGALIMVLLVGRKMKPEVIIDEINIGKGFKMNKTLYSIIMKYIAPIAIVLMFLQMLGIF